MADLLNVWSPMLTVLVCWAIVAPGLLGYGLAFRAWAGETGTSVDRLVVSFWVGFVCVIALLQLLHFVVPIQPWVSTLVLGGGWALAWHRRAPLVAWFSEGAKAQPIATLCVVALLLWLSNRAIGPCDPVDSGTYHTQAVRWNVEHPLVTGLANLNTCLGFNSSAWLYAAMFQAGPMDGRGNHGPTGLLMFSMAWLGGSAVWRLLRRDPAADSATVFDAVLLAPVIHLILGPDSASFRTDFPNIGLALIVGSRAYRLLLRSPTDTIAASRSTSPPFVELASMIVLSAGTLVVKIPAIVLVGGLAALCLGHWWFIDRDPPRRKALRVSLPLAMAAAISLCWAIRSIFISGYIVFPLQATAVDVPWRVPEFAVEALNAWVKQWARVETMTPDKAYMGWEWVVPWFKNFAIWDPFKFVYPLVGTIGLGLIALIARRRQSWHPWPRSQVLFLVPILTALAVWFVTAPAARWSNAMGWLTLAWLAGGLFMGLVPGRGAHTSERQRRGLVLAGLFAIALVMPQLLVRLVMLNKIHRRGPAAIAEMLFFKPGPDRGFQPNPAVELTTYTTDHGVVLTVPVDEDRVFEAPLPATPHPMANIRLRKPGDLSGGFELVGNTWMPLRYWPNKDNTWFAMWLQRRAAQHATAP